MDILPKNLTAYKRTPTFTEDTIPAGLLRDHQTKAGVWGVIHVEVGELRYVIPSWDEEYILTPDQNGIVSPGVLHHVASVGTVQFYVEFWR